MSENETKGNVVDMTGKEVSGRKFGPREQISWTIVGIGNADKEWGRGKDFNSALEYLQLREISDTTRGWLELMYNDGYDGKQRLAPKDDIRPFQKKDDPELLKIENATPFEVAAAWFLERRRFRVLARRDMDLGFLFGASKEEPSYSSIPYPPSPVTVVLKWVAQHPDATRQVLTTVFAMLERRIGEKRFLEMARVFGPIIGWEEPTEEPKQTEKVEDVPVEESEPPTEDPATEVAETKPISPGDRIIAGLVRPLPPVA